MESKKAGIFAITIALAAILALAGCGGSQPTPSSTSASTASSEQSADYIGEDAAKEIALKDAGIAEASTSGVGVNLDSEETPVHYDVNFEAGGLNYDYGIDALTGAVLTKELEIDN